MSTGMTNNKELIYRIFTKHYGFVLQTDGMKYLQDFFGQFDLKELELSGILRHVAEFIAERHGRCFDSRHHQPLKHLGK